MSNHNIPKSACDPKQERYWIEFDHVHNISRIRITGFWSESDARKYLSDLNRILEASRESFGFSRTLIDRRQCPVQSAAVTAIFQAYGAQLGPNDFVAVVVGSTLVHMQFERVTSRNSSRVFKDIAEAEAWLAEKPPRMQTTS